MPDIAMEQVTRAWARLRQTEPKVHAYVHTFESQAFELARRLDEEEPRGKLYGVPFAVKEVFDVAGVETTAGCRVFAGRTAISDATIVRRLRTLGAVLMGTQVSHELTWDSTSLLPEILGIWTAIPAAPARARAYPFQ